MTASPRGFVHVDTWVFDLDNTLYPHHVNLWQQVDARIGEFVADFLKVSAEEARRVQKDYYRRYGTTMTGDRALSAIALQGLRQAQPNISLQWVARELPMRRAEDREHYLDGLRRAGLE